jgi:hypothetical protein
VAGHPPSFFLHFPVASAAPGASRSLRQGRLRGRLNTCEGRPSCRGGGPP